MSEKDCYRLKPQPLPPRQPHDPPGNNKLSIWDKIGIVLACAVLGIVVILACMGLVSQVKPSKSLEELQNDRYRYEYREKKAEEQRQLKELIQRKIVEEQERSKGR